MNCTNYPTPNYLVPSKKKVSSYWKSKNEITRLEYEIYCLVWRYDEPEGIEMFKYYWDKYNQDGLANYHNKQIRLHTHLTHKQTKLLSGTIWKWVLYVFFHPKLWTFKTYKILNILK